MEPDAGVLMESLIESSGSISVASKVTASSILVDVIVWEFGWILAGELVSFTLRTIEEFSIQCSECIDFVLSVTCTAARLVTAIGRSAKTKVAESRPGTNSIFRRSSSTSKSEVRTETSVGEPMGTNLWGTNRWGQPRSYF